MCCGLKILKSTLFVFLARVKRQSDCYEFKVLRRIEVMLFYIYPCLFFFNIFLVSFMRCDRCIYIFGLKLFSFLIFFWEVWMCSTFSVPQEDFCIPLNFHLVLYLLTAWAAGLRPGGKIWFLMVWDAEEKQASEGASARPAIYRPATFSPQFVFT